MNLTRRYQGLQNHRSLNVHSTIQKISSTRVPCLATQPEQEFDHHVESLDTTAVVISTPGIPVHRYRDEKPLYFRT